MKDIKEIIKKLEEVRDLLDQNLESEDMDVAHMQEQIEDMIEEFKDVSDLELEGEEED